MAFGPTLSEPTRFPGGITNTTKVNGLGTLEMDSPIHQVLLGWGYMGVPGLPTGNTPATNADWTVTSTTTTGTASFADAASWPPRTLLTTGTTANDQVVMQDKRTVKKNFLGGAIRKVLVAGSFRITSTVANSKGTIGIFTGTSNSSLGNDSFTFNWSGATLNFVNRNNAGTALTTAVSTAVTINTAYGCIALLNPTKSTVSVWFGSIDSLDLRNSANTPQELPATNTITVASTNIPDGTNAVSFGFGAQTTAGAAATVEFGPCFAMIV